MRSCSGCRGERLSFSYDTLFGKLGFGAPALVVLSIFALAPCVVRYLTHLGDVTWLGAFCAFQFVLFLGAVGDEMVPWASVSDLVVPGGCCVSWECFCWLLVRHCLARRRRQPSSDSSTQRRVWKCGWPTGV